MKGEVFRLSIYQPWIILLGYVMGADHSQPGTYVELSLLANGYRYIAGLDEVGRGCIAGPVVAAAVVLPAPILRQPEPLAGVRDSKQMPPFDREKAAGVIWRLAHSIGIGFVGPRIIEEIGIVAATRQAMVNAVSFLRPQPDYAIIDYLNLPELTLPNHGITYGDTLCLTIAAASVVAKVARDNLMREQECCYPGYGFFNNKGYCTAEHLDALERLGPCPIHRRNFSPVAQHSMFRGLDATPKG